MTIAVGTISNSGNQTNSTGFTVSSTIDSTAQCVVVVVTGYDSSATDSVVNSVSLGRVRLTEIGGGRFRNASDFQSIWYLKNPKIVGAGLELTVTMAGTCTDVQATTINLYDSAADTIVYDSFDTGTGTGSASGVVSPAKTGAIAIGGGVAVGGNAGSLSVSTGTEATGSEVDMGSQTASVGYAFESGGSATITWSYTGVACTCLVATFYPQNYPTVALSSPADGGTTSDTTPELLFTGTDPEGDGIDYQVSLIDTVTTGFDLKYVDFYIDKVGSPAGNLYCDLYSGDVEGPVLATSDAVAESVISTTASYVRFTFASTVALTTGQAYVVAIRTTRLYSITNYIRVYGHPAAAYPDGESSKYYYQGWIKEDTSQDYAFKILDSTPTTQIQNIQNSSASALYGVGDAGGYGIFAQSFTVGDRLANTYKTSYSSGVQASHTFGNTLTVGNTYYWRVRAVDTASGMYGPWSSVYSFTVTAGTPTNIVLMCIES